MAHIEPVELLRYVPPRFPDRCTACGRERPGDYTTIRGDLPMGSVNLWPPRRWYRVQVPVCAACRSSIESARWVRRGVWGLTAIASGLCVIWITVKFGPIRRRMLLLAALPIVLPAIAWDLWFTRFLSIDAGHAKVQFKFQNAEVAREFAALNHVTHEVQLDALVDGGIKAPRDC